MYVQYHDGPLTTQNIVTKPIVSRGLGLEGLRAWLSRQSVTAAAFGVFRLGHTILFRVISLFVTAAFPLLNGNAVLPFLLYIIVFPSIFFFILYPSLPPFLKGEVCDFPTHKHLHLQFLIYYYRVRNCQWLGPGSLSKLFSAL